MFVLNVWQVCFLYCDCFHLSKQTAYIDKPIDSIIVKHGKSGMWKNCLCYNWNRCGGSCTPVFDETYYCKASSVCPIYCRQDTDCTISSMILQLGTSTLKYVFFYWNLRAYYASLVLLLLKSTFDDSCLPK